MIRRLRGIARLTAWFIHLLLRDRQLVFWNFGFFLILLALFLGVLSRGESAVRVALTAAIVTIGLMGNALFSVGVGLSSARDRGVFRRYALTPTPMADILAATIVARVLIVFAAAVAELAVARVFFQVTWVAGASTPLTCLLAAGSAVFGAIGFAIAALARAPHVANTLANLVFIPMMALSGASLPASMMPPAWAAVHGALPATPIVDGLNALLVGGAGWAETAPRLGWLALWTIGAVVLGAYRWSLREP